MARKSDTYSSTHAARPSPGKQGDLHFPTNGFVISRDDGVAWVPWGAMFPCTEPDDSEFSWVNQESASVDASLGGIYILAPVGAGNDLRCRVKAAPTPPYTVTALFLVNHLVGGFSGLLWRESGTGELVTLHMGNHSDRRQLQIYKWNSATSGSAAYASHNLGGKSCWGFLRIADDGANRLSSWSVDGQDWFQVHSVGRTDFLTADQVGFFVNSTSASVAAGALLMSWKES